MYYPLLIKLLFVEIAGIINTPKSYSLGVGANKVVIYNFWLS